MQDSTMMHASALVLPRPTDDHRVVIRHAATSPEHARTMSELVSVLSAILRRQLAHGGQP